MDDLTSSNINHQAISAALEARWDDALKLNKKIIKLDPQNVDGLARLGRAYMEMGRFNLAKKYYNEALKTDPYNPIASKNLKIIKSFKSNSQPKIGNGHSKLSSSLFLQEPGKSKIVNLLKVAEPQKLLQAYCGMQVGVTVKNRKITVVDGEGTYLGVLPDDICHHLMRLLRGGNKYEFFIKSVRVNSLSLLIRETFRSRRFKNQPSFLEGS
ncbi:MAG: tetratricopeptide repeat protein, partial [Candidatus Daviesbacteria bacterium]|nr:tetratricopeptide repeat protein [Candidatus Daviesbacteria bacterium]